MMKSIPCLFASIVMLALATPASAQTREVPYWTSLRVDAANMRVGPSGDYRIMWTYRRKQLPLKVVRLKEGWRLVEDPAGVRGWMLARFLTLDRSAIVQGKGLADMRAKPDAASRLLWRLEPDVTGALGECVNGWCEFTVTRHRGFVRQDRLWGPGEP